MRRAVCVIIQSVAADNIYLGVTRRNQPDRLGLPGGKVDPGESEIDAVIRETFEETGIKLEHDKLVPIYTALCPGDVNYWVTTFYYTEPVDFSPFSSLPEVEVGITPRPVLFKHLMDPKYSPFAAYNCGVAGAIAHYKLLGTS